MRYPWPPEEPPKGQKWSFEQIASRFDFFLRRRYSRYDAPSKGIIVADENRGSLAQTLKRHYRHVQQHGHRWGHPVYNLVETVFFLQSEDSPGVQLADLCASGVWRFVTRNETSVINKIRDYFDRELLDSPRNPGKWHGVSCRVADPSSNSASGTLLAGVNFRRPGF